MDVVIFRGVDIPRIRDDGTNPFSLLMANHRL